MVMLNETSWLIDEQQMAQGWDLVVMVALRAAIVVFGRGREHLEQQCGVEQAHSVGMDLPAAASCSTIRIRIEARLGDVNPLITIEAATSASSQHLVEDTTRIIRNLVMAGPSTRHREDFTVQILMFGRAFVLECQVFGFGPV